MVASDNHESPITNSMDSSNSGAEHQTVEEEWMVVKKQRIIILIPPPSPVDPQHGSPVAQSSKSTKIARRRLGNPRKRGRRLSNSRSPKPTATFSENQLHAEGELGKPAAGLSDYGTQTDGDRLGYQKRLQNLVSPIATGTVNNSQDHISRMPLIQCAPPSHPLVNGNDVVHWRTRRISSSRKMAGAPMLPIGVSNVANWRVRALNLERKLQLLGGLRSWLVSQGLGQFIRIFGRERVGIYQLVNLTMSKLKDMGADAVGPRRKLIHAIECLCKPYYFEDCKN